jgi:hypothetical protein
MAYDETTYRRSDDDQGDPAAYRANGLTGDYRGRRRDADPEDDSGSRYADGTSPRSYDGRDRLGFHIGWEIVLLLAVAALAYLLYRLDHASLQRPALDGLLISGAVIGLLTMGAGLTLRAGVPNLAIGPVALLGALQYAEQGDKGLLHAALPAVVIAAVGGLVAATFVLGLHVPGWAVSLAAAMGVVVIVQQRTHPEVVQGDFDPANYAFWLFGGFAVLAVLGGAFGTVTPIRNFLGRTRPVSDPADRRGRAALPVVFALVLSSVFAVVAGMLMAAQSTPPIVPDTGLQWTGIAFGTALLAGTSAFGRRGGVFGTLLAVAAMALFLDYQGRRNLDIALFAIGACAIGGGLVITRLVETYGRPLPGDAADEDWNAAATTAASGNNWSPEMPETSWSPGTQAPSRWDEGPWGTGR